MRILVAVLAIALVLVLGLFVVNRVRARPEVGDTTWLEAAIETYLANKSMAMKVASFEDVVVEGDRATVVCRMQEASGLYGGLAVRWEFDLRLAGRGGWRVEGHRTL